MNPVFKVGDLVKCIGNHHSNKNCKNKIGKIIYRSVRSVDRYTVRFFQPIKYGHSGKDFGIGKPGYCWSLLETEIKLYGEPILKIFLKEKTK